MSLCTVYSDPEAPFVYIPRKKVNYTNYCFCLRLQCKYIHSARSESLYKIHKAYINIKRQNQIFTAHVTALGFPNQNLYLFYKL
jgi:G:T-mismatch repair DNA endonuclease (very short patch repair protein)